MIIDTKNGVWQVRTVVAGLVKEFEDEMVTVSTAFFISLLFIQVVIMTGLFNLKIVDIEQASSDASTVWFIADAP